MGRGEGGGGVSEQVSERVREGLRRVCQERPDNETKRQRERVCQVKRPDKEQPREKKGKKVARQRDRLREREGGSERERDRERGEQEGVGWVSLGGGRPKRRLLLHPTSGKRNNFSNNFHDNLNTD